MEILEGVDVNNSDGLPLLSVCIMTFNHEKFIAQTLDSVLSQKARFEFEIILGEDESSDGTRKICIEYANKFPGKIHLVLRERKDVIYIDGNATGRFNFIENLKLCRGRYIALLDGDDYWIDENKLQKQVDFLEINSKYSGCSANALENQGSEFKQSELYKDCYSFEDLLSGNSIYTCSAVFRNTFTIPDWFSKCKMGDWALWLLITQNGPIYNFRETMAVYRMHNNSIWFSKGKEKNLKDIIATYDFFLNEFDPKLKKKLRTASKPYYYNLLNLLRDKRNSQIFSWTFKSFFKF
jgi:glycosyltransferase involved in cell wall biosynthesis